jgi:hypothetical protein
MITFRRLSSSVNTEAAAFAANLIVAGSIANEITSGKISAKFEKYFL